MTASDEGPHGLEAPLAHGARHLTSVRVDAYNAELHDPAGRGFLGDRASNRAFVEMLEDWRVRVRRGMDGGDPIENALGERKPTREIDRGELDTLLLAVEEDPEASGLVQSAVEDFAQEMAAVVRRLLRIPAWRGTERIAVGGGFVEAKVGRMAVGRVGILLKAGGEPVRMTPISRPPDEAALCGAAHLVPPEALRAHDAILAVDVGGTNLRAGLVALGLDEADDLARARAVAVERWCHADERPTRDAALARLLEMLRGLAGQANDRGLVLAPFVGVGCPGLVLADGTIERGGQNLPGGGWEGRDFNLPAHLQEALPALLGHHPAVVMHNDAVVQGLSEAPMMRDVERWGVLTVGTGLGNARFSNRRPGR